MFFRIITLSICCLFTFSSKTRAAEFADEKGTIPIAAWDIVPYQIIKAPFKAGVVAFHEESVGVDFTVTAAGKIILKTQIDAPKLNDRTNVWEYFITIDPATIPDGPFYINATCIPGGDGNRTIELSPITLYANSKGSLKFKSVFVDSAKGDDENPGTEDKPMRTLGIAVKKNGVEK